ncbi:MAG: zf-HC2 domain-containing protein [Armatimonadetes bacterium]|nr:zf-HC2 domain-containing protein [Armatimonadota bacterium]
MKCDKALELMSAYCEGDLGPALSVPFQAHLADCASCRSAACDVARLHQGLTALPLAPVSDSLRVEIWRRIEAGEKPIVPARRFAWRFGPARLALAAGGAVLVVTLAGRVALPGAFHAAGWTNWLTGSRATAVRTEASTVPFTAGAASLRHEASGVILSIPVTNTSKAAVVFSASVPQSDGGDGPVVTVAPGMSAVLSVSTTMDSTASRISVRWKQGSASGSTEYTPVRSL